MLVAVDDVARAVRRAVFDVEPFCVEDGNQIPNLPETFFGFAPLREASSSLSRSISAACKAIVSEKSGARVPAIVNSASSSEE